MTTYGGLNVLTKITTLDWTWLQKTQIFSDEWNVHVGIKNTYLLDGEETIIECFFLNKLKHNYEAGLKYSTCIC
jgi:hypothetical protein